MIAGWKNMTNKDQELVLSQNNEFDIKIRELQWVLDHASGGGDWRRVIEMRIGELRANEMPLSL